MVLPSESAPDLPSFEIYPPEVLNPRDGDVPDVTQLRVAGGTVEVIDRQDLSATQLRVVMLAAAGLKRKQIDQVLGKETRHAETQIYGALQVLDASDQVHAVHRLFESRIARVVKPIVLPAISKRQRTVLNLTSQGVANREIAESLGLYSGTVDHHMSKLYAAIGTSSPPRAVLLGHLGGILPDNCGTRRIATGAGDCSSISPASALVEPNVSGIHFDYVAWKGGVFSVHKDSSLDFDEQRALLLSAVGLDAPRSALLVDKTDAAVSGWLQKAYEKLGVRNRAHAVTQALARGDLMITRYAPEVGLTQAEWLSLVDAALGVKSDESIVRMGKSGTAARNLNAKVFDKMGVANITAAVMRAYLSKELDIDHITDTYGARQLS